jgi:deoxycytidine triphosphate deaminase/addiction module HigA family antidote
MRADHRGATAADGPLTPGEHLRAEIERLGLDQVAVSRATGVSRQSINNIVNDRQPISRAMAGKLARLTGHSADYWLRATFGAPSSTSGMDRQTRPFCLLLGQQIIQAVRDGVLTIDPFDKNHVQSACLDLTLDDFVLTTQGRKKDISDGQSFSLKRGASVGVTTKEWIELPQGYAGRTGTKAALAQAGIMTSQTFQLEPGFRGSLRLWLFNAGAADFMLRGGDPIVSVEFVSLRPLA